MNLNEQFDLIIHLAGKSGVRESLDDPASYWRNNVEVSKSLFARYPILELCMQVVPVHMNLI